MVFSFFWVFCTSLPNQVEHACLRFQLQICKYEWARIIFVDGDLDSKLQHYDLVKILEKNQKLHIHIEVVTLKVTSCRTMSKKKKWKTKILWAKQTIFWEPCPSALGQFQPHGCSLENSWKMSLILVFNKNSPQAHTESELGVLGVHGKLVKYVVHSSRRKNWKKKKFLHTSCPNSNRPIFGLKDF
jgi:hypothetical protein